MSFWNLNDSGARRFGIPLVGTACVIVIILISCWLGGKGQPELLTPTQAAAKPLADADRQTQQAVHNRLNTLKTLFERGSRGADAFAEDALSWSGKWALIQGTLGLGEDDAHGKFLALAFSKHVLSGDDLQRELEGAITGFLSDLDGIENQMLVQLRADLADSTLGRKGLPPCLQNDAAFRAEYRRLEADLKGLLASDAQVMAGREVAAFVAMDVATTIVLRIVQVVAAELGVEAGILGAGAASSVATLGVGLIVGLIVDQAFTWVMKKAGYDPAQEIAGKVRASLSRIESLLLNGCEGQSGLSRELQALQAARSKLRHAVINKLLQ